MTGKPDVPPQFILELKDYIKELETDRDELDGLDERSVEQQEELSSIEDEIEDVESLIDTLEAF